MSRQTLIFSPEFQELERVTQHWLREWINSCRVEFNNFRDWWPNIFVHQVEDIIEHREVTMVMDFSKPKFLLRNMSLIHSIIDNTADKVRLILPFFPVWTMERAKKRGEVVTAKTFAKILSTIPQWRKWKTSIHIFDIHDVRIKDFFNDNVNVELHTGMHLVETDQYDAICFPDKGAAERFSEFFKGKEIIICDKVRDGDDRRVTIKEWNPQDKNILVVDDLIQTWWTSIETWVLLKDQWANSVNAYATHGVFPEESHKKVAEAFDTLIVSDSIPENIKRAKALENMKIQTIAPLITSLMVKG